MAELKAIQAEIADIERKDKAAKGKKGRQVYEASVGAGTVMLLCQDRAELKSGVAREIKALDAAAASRIEADKQVVDREGLSF